MCYFQKHKRTETINGIGEIDVQTQLLIKF